MKVGAMEGQQWRDVLSQQGRMFRKMTTWEMFILGVEKKEAVRKIIRGWEESVAEKSWAESFGGYFKSWKEHGFECLSSSTY